MKGGLRCVLARKISQPQNGPFFDPTPPTPIQAMPPTPTHRPDVKLNPFTHKNKLVQMVHY